ncbi:hypothetical protein SY85_12550 [Flavisolibacter tropicus]|uniref:Secretion system C-terminal sorting domain-containing protein n=2 Tax=Flavisolibacter tropicus TaxID=1492898 RepID=A0A172TW49_9BACT|nr:hypothetical protein SY85_12550 [Flavisolibacter tropicus]
MTTINVNCGETLEITDLFLAWTTSNSKETCDVLSKGSATINPKCGTVPKIKIGLGVTADFEATKAICQLNGNATGTIKIKPNGGTAPYKVKIGNDERIVNAVGDSTTYTLAPNTYDILITDSKGCNISFQRTIDAPPTVSVNGIGNALTKNCIQNTNGGIIGETSASGFSYSWSPATGLSSTSIGNPTANPTATTTYTVTKTNTSTGCSAQANVIVTVDNAPVAMSGVSDFTKTCITNPNGKNIGETAQAGYTYSWSSTPAGYSSASSNPMMNPPATITYTVRKTKTSSGCFADASATVIVNNAPVTVSAGAAFTKSCTSNVNGATIGETPVDGFSYSWSPATGLSDDKIGNPTANPSATTTYTVTKTDNTSGCSKQASVTVTVDNTPISVAAGNNFTKTCTQNTNGATIGETPVTGYTYSWLPITGLSNASIGNPTANPGSTTTYTVTKTYTSSGCSNTASVTVTVDNGGVNINGIGGAFTKTCTQNTNGGTIGETPVSGFTYSWSPAASLSNDKIGNPTANPTATTTYTVTKTNTATGCSAQANVTVTVDNGPVTVSGIGGAFTKTCTTNTGGNIIGETPVNGFSYSWSPATGLSNDKIGNPNANPSATTTYTVTKTNTNTGCFRQATVTVTVNNTVPTFTVCLVQPTLCANSGGVTFTATGGSGFEYSIDNGAHYQTGNSFTGLGSGSVTGFLVRNSFGCVSTPANCNTTSQCESLLSSPTTASQQQTEILDQGLKVKAYPNPFNNRIRFEVNATEAGNGSLEVYNTLGQKVKTVYRGFMKSGIQTFELNVPANQHSTLIYIFKMGSKQVTGKLVSAGN